MARRTILYCGDPILARKARRIREIDDALHELLHDMEETMIAADGLGLAAAQVGELIAAVTVRRGADTEEVLGLINPEIVEAEGEQAGTEACLSLPTLRGTVVRPQRVVVEAFDAAGKSITIEGEGLMARCLAHELDHLAGRLFIDVVRPDSLVWVRPDDTEEDGYREESTTVEEARAAFERLRKQREGR